jgi:hypothetical protein
VSAYQSIASLGQRIGFHSSWQCRPVALTVTVIGLALLPPGIARAQFTVTGGTVFNNGTTSTDAGTNTNPNAGANSNSNQSFSYNGVASPVNGGAIAGVNASTGTITGYGLILDGTAGFSVTGTTVTMTNNGKIDTTSPGPIVLQALGLTSDGGAITYNGSGSVLNTPANGNGVGCQRAHCIVDPLHQAFRIRRGHSNLAPELATKVK